MDNLKWHLPQLMHNTLISLISVNLQIFYTYFNTKTRNWFTNRSYVRRLLFQNQPFLLDNEASTTRKPRTRCCLWMASGIREYVLRQCAAMYVWKQDANTYSSLFDHRRLTIMAFGMAWNMNKYGRKTVAKRFTNTHRIKPTECQPAVLVNS